MTRCLLLAEPYVLSAEDDGPGDPGYLEGDGDMVRAEGDGSPPTGWEREQGGSGGSAVGGGLMQEV